MLRLKTSSLLVISLLLLNTAFAAASSINDSSFETTNTSWNNTQWQLFGGSSGNIEPWARRTGNAGVAAYGWSNNGYLGFYQDVSAQPNTTYEFSIWARKENNFNESKTELKLEWLDANKKAVRQPIIDFKQGETNAAGFSKLTIKGHTSSQNVAYLRLVVFTEWNAPLGSHQAAMMFDDAALNTKPFDPSQYERSNYVQTALDYFDESNGRIVVDATSGYPFDGELYSLPYRRDWTQPTAIGFYAMLLSQIVSGDITTPHISKPKAVQELLKMSRSLLIDQVNVGHLGLLPFMQKPQGSTNWIRWQDEYPLLDNANLTVALVSASGALIAYDSDVEIHEIRENIDTFITQQLVGYKALYNSNSGLFYRLFDAKDGGAPKILESDKSYVDEAKSAILLIALLEDVLDDDQVDDIPLSVYSNQRMDFRPYTLQSGEIIYPPAPPEGAFQILWPILNMPELDSPALKRAYENFVDVSIDFAERNDIAGFNSASFNLSVQPAPGEDNYLPAQGIRSITSDLRNVTENIGSLYTLGPAHQVRPDSIDLFFSNILSEYPFLNGGTGYWEGVNSQNPNSPSIIEVQVLPNVLSFALGIVGKGPEYSKAYLAEKNLLDDLNVIYNRYGSGSPTNIVSTKDRFWTNTKLDLQGFWNNWFYFYRSNFSEPLISALIYDNNGLDISAGMLNFTYYTSTNVKGRIELKQMTDEGLKIVSVIHVDLVGGDAQAKRLQVPVAMPSLINGGLQEVVFVLEPSAEQVNAKGPLLFFVNAFTSKP